MKKITILLSIIVLYSAVIKAADSSFTITGKLDKIKSGTILLTIYGNDQQHLTCKIANGTFSFTGFIQKPAEALLTIKDKAQDYLSFYVEAGIIKISGSGNPLKDLVINNSALNNENALLKQQLQGVSKWEDDNEKVYEKASLANNKAVLDSLDEVDFDVLAEKRKVVAAFVQTHPNSLMSAIAIAQNYAYYAEADEVEPLYNLLDDHIKNTANGQDLKKLIDLYKTVAIGRLAPGITQPTLAGPPMSLSMLQGKYVLVDFWASWCPPCRRENPNLVKLFNTYKSKGFDVFGVSYDTKKEKWEKAIKDDELNWNQVSDLGGWKNSTSDVYGIKAIPSNLLLDKEGRIIAKNIFGKKLAAKLADLLK